MTGATANPRVAIEIYVDDQGSVRIREFADQAGQNLDQLGNRNQTVTDRIRAGWNSVKAAWIEVTAGVMALNEAWNMMNASAKAEQERVSFENLAASYGKNAYVMVAALKKASGETLSTMDLMRSAGTAMMMGINPDTIVRLMDIARATSKMTGQTVAQAFGDISLAVGRQSRMILDNLGIIVNVEKANEDYARGLGKTAEQLSDAERKQAFLNATVTGGEELMKRLGTQTDTNADRLQRLSASANELKDAVGEGLIRAFNFLLGTMQSVAAVAMALSGGIFKVIGASASMTDSLHITSGAAQRWKIETQAAFASAEDLAKKADQSFKDMSASTDKASQSQAKFKGEVKGAADAVDQLAAAENKRKKIADDAKRQADEQARATEEMYREAGMGADQYFRQEASKLVEKAAKWQAAGAATLQTEEWLYGELNALSEEAWGKGNEMAGVYLDSMSAQTQSLVDEFNKANTTMVEKLGEVGAKAEELDGTKIGLVTTFDGTAVIQGLDELIAKFRQLKEAANNAATDTQRSSLPDVGDKDTSPSASRATANVTNTSNTTIVVSQKVSRSDILAIAAENRRREARV